MMDGNEITNKSDHLYQDLGCKNLDLLSAIKKFNELFKKNSIRNSSAIIDIREKCNNFIDEKKCTIESNKNFIKFIDEDPINDYVNYFKNTLENSLIKKEELVKISYNAKNKGKITKEIKIIRIIVLPDDYKDNNSYITTESFEKFRLDIMNYILNTHCMGLFNTGIIQFPHPGGEHLVDKPGYSFKVKDVIKTKQMPWNDATSHRRKYLLTTGQYVNCDDNGKYILSDKMKIVFWGEWEPQSKIINESANGNPKYLHIPIITKEIIGQKLEELQNTDPYVFGKDILNSSFHYCCCKQIKNKKPTYMQKLEIGNVILFGSYNGKTDKFRLDTVFVVGDKGKNYTKYGNEKLDVSNIYKYAVIDKVRKGNQHSLSDDKYELKSNYERKGCINPEDNDEFKLYKSATFNDKVNECFSFFPCKVYNNIGNNFFPRVELDLEKFGLSNATQGNPMKTNGNLDNKEKDDLYITQHFINNYLNGVYNLPSDIVSELDNCIDKLKQGKTSKNIKNILSKCYWNALVSEVLNQGYYLGIFAEEPKFDEEPID